MNVERVIVGAVLVGGLGVQWWHSREQREELARLRDELGRVSATVQTLERRTFPALELMGAVTGEAGRAPVLAPPGMLQMPGAPGPVGESVPVAAVPPPAAAAAMDSTAAQAHVEQFFQTESADSGWAADAQREVRDNLSSLLPASASVRALDCRATLCRLELDFAEDASFREAMGRPGAMSRLWKGPSMARIERDASRGSVTLVGYLVRPGHPMPMPPSDADTP